MRRAACVLGTALLIGGCTDAPERPPTVPVTPEAELLRYQELLARDPEAALLQYDVGTLLLQRERFAEARPPLERATRAERLGLRERSFYNLGNTDLEPAFLRRLEGEREAALRRAIEAYRSALLLDPSDMDAKWNLELARRLLEEERQSPENDPQGGGGGGGGGEGGGGGSDSQRGDNDPRPQAGGQGQTAPQLTEEEADRILSDARRQELGVQQDKLRKPQPRDPTAH